MPCLQVLLIVFGLVGTFKGEFNITKNLRVSGSVGRILGITLLIGGLFSLLNGVLGLPILVLVIVAGAITAQPTGVGLDTKIFGNSLGRRIIALVVLGLGIALLCIVPFFIPVFFGTAVGDVQP